MLFCQYILEHAYALEQMRSYAEIVNTSCTCIRVAMIFACFLLTIKSKRDNSDEYLDYFSFDSSLHLL